VNLLGQGHKVVIHARSRSRLTEPGDLVARGTAAVVGDLSSVEETRGVAGQVNQPGAHGRGDPQCRGSAQARRSSRSTSSPRTCWPRWSAVPRAWCTWAAECATAAALATLARRVRHAKRKAVVSQPARRPSGW